MPGQEDLFVTVQITSASLVRFKRLLATIDAESTMHPDHGAGVYRVNAALPPGWPRLTVWRNLVTEAQALRNLFP